MIDTTSQTPAKKKTVRKKVVSKEPTSSPVYTPLPSLSVTADFTSLTEKINKEKEGFENLLKEIVATRETWAKEQKDYEIRVKERNEQDEVNRKRENETYLYETQMRRKREEDEFQMKKLQWERELNERKDELKKEKEELGILRKQVAGFDQELEKAVNQALEKLEKDLTSQFAVNTKIREQEIKADKEILNLKVNNLALENTRLTKEMENLKKALEEATKQVKEIAVKVIEGRTPQPPTQPAQ